MKDYGLKYKAMFMTVYGGGLRISELCNLRIQDIDSKNMRILIREGKESKYRYTLLSQINLEILREYFKVYRPKHKENYLFISQQTNDKYTVSGPEIAFREIRKKAGITRKVTVHGLRHNFATNYCIDQYEKHGFVDIYKLMILMGHEDVKTTNRYLHIANQIIVSRESVSHIDKIFQELQGVS